MLSWHTAAGYVDGDGVELEADGEVDCEVQLEVVAEDAVVPLPEDVEVVEAPGDETLIAPT